MAILASKDFTAAKMLPPVGLDLVITGSGDYHWFKSPVLNQPLIPILPFLTTLNQLWKTGMHATVQNAMSSGNVPMGLSVSAYAALRTFFLFVFLFVFFFAGSLCRAFVVTFDRKENEHHKHFILFRTDQFDSSSALKSWTKKMAQCGSAIE